MSKIFKKHHQIHIEKLYTIQTCKLRLNDAQPWLWKGTERKDSGRPRHPSAQKITLTIQECYAN